MKINLIKIKSIVVVMVEGIFVVLFFMKNFLKLDDGI